MSKGLNVATNYWNRVAAWQDGQRFEKERVGYCHDDIRAAIDSNEGK